MGAGLVPTAPLINMYLGLLCSKVKGGRRRRRRGGLHRVRSRWVPARPQQGRVTRSGGMRHRFRGLSPSSSLTHPTHSHAQRELLLWTHGYSDTGAGRHTSPHPLTPRQALTDAQRRPCGPPDAGQPESRDTPSPSPQPSHNTKKKKKPHKHTRVHSISQKETFLHTQYTHAHVSTKVHGTQ